MSYSERPDGYKGIKYGGVAMAVLGIGFMLRTCTNFVGGLPPTTPESAERELLADAESGPVFATMKRTYPAEFEGLTKEIAGRGSQFQGTDQIATGARTFLLAAMGRHLAEIAQAPHDALAEYRRKEIAVVEALKTHDVALCAAYFASGEVKPQAPDTALKQAMRDFQIQTWVSEAAGRDTPIGRAITSPSPQDGKGIIDRGIAAGINRNSLVSLLDGKRMPDAEECGAGVQLLRGIDGLPEKQADNFTAFLAQSAAKAR